MSRLFAIVCAIAMLGAVVDFPAFASKDELIIDEEQTTPAAVHELADLPPKILEKLDPKSIAKILLAREESRIVAAEGHGSEDQDVEIVPIAFFLTILVVVIATLGLRYRKHAQTQETLRLMIEKGAEIPPELLTPPVSHYGDLRRGLILAGTGLSLSIAIGLMRGFGGGGWALGLIPLFIGAGYLIVWRYSQQAASN